MIEWWQKSKPKKYLELPTNQPPPPPKKKKNTSLDSEKLTPKNIPCWISEPYYSDFMKQIRRNALNIKNNRKTSLIVLFSQNYAAGIREHYHESSGCFENPKKFLLKSPLKSKQNILSKFSDPKKIPESKISNPEKSFDHPRHLKSWMPPPSPPPTGQGTHLAIREINEFDISSFVIACDIV